MVKWTRSNSCGLLLTLFCSGINLSGCINIPVDNDHDEHIGSADCDDNNPDIYNGAEELCDGIDSNCDNIQDTDVCDNDNDGFVAQDDCNDEDASINPDMPEICDPESIDEDCDLDVNDDDANVEGQETYYTDADGDGFGVGAGTLACSQPEGTSAATGDCDDTNSTINPDMPEICDPVGKDEDCDLDVNDGDDDVEGQTTFFYDNDNDGFGTPSESESQDACSQPKHYVANDKDCDDTNLAINPDMPEICDPAGIDEDCDLDVNDGDDDVEGQTTFFYDDDNDGFGTSSQSQDACFQPDGYVANDKDCDDTNPIVNPDMPEICDQEGIDEDCDLDVNDDDANVKGQETYYADADGDGFGVGAGTLACSQPEGTSAATGDCDDSNPALHPEAVDNTCDGLDDNCDGRFDEGTAVLGAYYSDKDGDGFGDTNTMVTSCICPEGYVGQAGDCNDSRADINPSALDTGNDENCDGNPGPFIQVSAGAYHVLALRKDGSVWAWGDNQYGQLGDGTLISHSRPARVLGIGSASKKAIKVEAGWWHSLALLEDGTVWEWGQNYYDVSPGQVSLKNFMEPVQVSGLTQASDISAGELFSLAIAGNKVYAWGRNDDGRLGQDASVEALGTPTLVPDRNPGVEYPGFVNANFTTVSAGEYHSLALDDSGKLYAWGRQWGGILCNGHGEKATVYQPSQIPSPDANATIKVIDAGTITTHFILSDTTVWGCGSYALGGGDITDSYTPVPVKFNGETATLNRIKAISSGSQFVLAVDMEGQVWGWGINDSEVLGFEYSYRDNQLSGAIKIGDAPKTPTKAPTVAAGYAFGIARLTDDGTIVTWGDDAAGQLGRGAARSSSVAGPVEGFGSALPSPGAISAGQGYSFYSMSQAVDEAGQVWVWGANQSWSLGLGLVDPWISTPTKLKGQDISGLNPDKLGPAIRVASGGYYSLAISDKNELWGWGGTWVGAPNAYDEPARLTGVLSMVPSVASISAANDHVLLISKDDQAQVWAWGSNDYGQLGDGTFTDTLTALHKDFAPVAVIQCGGEALTGATSIVAAEAGSMATTADGRLWYWGLSRMADYKRTNCAAPVKTDISLTTDLQGITQAALGATHALALDVHGKVWSFGFNEFGQLGESPDSVAYRQYPAIVEGLPDPAINPVIQVAANQYTSLVLLADHTVMAWGRAVDGQLGDSKTEDNYLPRRVLELIGVEEISGGSGYTIARLDDGTLMAWGEDASGQLGAGREMMVRTFVQVW